jgi:hypothetical protein
MVINFITKSKEIEVPYILISSVSIRFDPKAIVNGIKSVINILIIIVPYILFNKYSSIINKKTT